MLFLNSKVEEYFSGNFNAMQQENLEYQEKNTYETTWQCDILRKKRNGHFC